MGIPNVERAVIDPIKLHGYLLSRSHPVGRFKAAFFTSLGSRARNWRQLESDLRTQHLPLDAVVRATSARGRK